MNDLPVYGRQELIARLRPDLLGELQERRLPPEPLYQRWGAVDYAAWAERALRQWRERVRCNATR